MSDHQPVPSDGTHLTDQQRALIEHHMTRILQALELDHWHVWVADNLPPEGARLMIEPTDGRRCAMLHVASDWWNTTATDKTIDLTHEALHLAHHDAEEVIRTYFRQTGDVADCVAGLIVRQFKINLERMVDGLSYPISKWVPQWPTVHTTSSGDLDVEYAGDRFTIRTTTTTTTGTA